METSILFKDFIIPILTLLFGAFNILIIYRALKIQSETHKLNVEKHKVEMHIQKITYWPDIDIDIISQFIGTVLPDEPTYDYGSHLCLLNLKVLKNSIRIIDIKTQTSDEEWLPLSNLKDEDFKNKQLTNGNELSISIGSFNDGEAFPSMSNEYMFKCEVIYEDLIGNRYSKTVVNRYKNKVVQMKEIELNSIFAK